MSFICVRMKNDFHIKGWAPTLVLKQRPGGTRKWPIGFGLCSNKLPICVKGWRSSESACFPPIWPGFKSRLQCHVGWVCCWFSPFAVSVFSPGTPVFPSPQKPIFPNSNQTRNQVGEEPLCGCTTSKSLFSYYLFYVSLQGQYSPSYVLCPETYNWIPIEQCRPKIALSNYSRLDDSEEGSPCIIFWEIGIVAIDSCFALWLQSRSVLSSFGVVLMSRRVNFYVVRSALQYSACRI